MNTGVEILLRRMADCPEDFDYRLNEGRPSRWMRLVDHAIGDEIVTQEEKDALNAGLIEMKRQRFTEMVMKELAGVEDETSDEGKLYIKPKTATLSAGLTQHTLDAQKYQTEMMRQHLDTHRKALKTVEVRKKATLR